jgi:hypothetical protein
MSWLYTWPAALAVFSQNAASSIVNQTNWIVQDCNRTYIENVINETVSSQVFMPFILTFLIFLSFYVQYHLYTKVSLHEDRIQAIEDSLEKEEYDDDEEDFEDEETDLGDEAVHSDEEEIDLEDDQEVHSGDEQEVHSGDEEQNISQEEIEDHSLPVEETEVQPLEETEVQPLEETEVQPLLVEVSSHENEVAEKLILDIAQTINDALNES